MCYHQQQKNSYTMPWYCPTWTTARLYMAGVLERVEGEVRKSAELWYEIDFV